MGAAYSDSPENRVAGLGLPLPIGKGLTYLIEGLMSEIEKKSKNAG